MPQTLYIIGNGFDLYHELKTKYQHFAFYLKDKKKEIYNMLLEFYGLPDLNQEDKNSIGDPLWGDFENTLAKLDFESALSSKTDYLPNYGSDDFKSRDYHAYEFEMESMVNQLTKNLFQAFKDFILTVQFLDPPKVVLLQLEGNSTFLNFNYTDTLENYYGIKRSHVLYIHGRAKTDGEQTILGHGIDPEQFKEKEVHAPEGLSAEELERWTEEKADGYDSAYERGKAELQSYFSVSFKSTGEIIERNEAFFDSLKDIQKVIVLGHSISEVDQPYFHKVFQSIKKKDSTWIVSYYSDQEKVTFQQRLIQIGLTENQIDLIKTETLKPKAPTLFDD